MRASDACRAGATACVFRHERAYVAYGLLSRTHELEYRFEVVVQKIPLSLATPGMKLLYAVAGANGTPLAEANELLDSAALHRIELAGIKEIIVYDNAVPGYDMGYNVVKRLERLPFLFRQQQDDVFMARLQGVLHKHFYERL